MVVEKELPLNVVRNQYILSTKKFKLMVGKTMSYKDPKYYDIPTDGMVWSLLCQHDSVEPGDSPNHSPKGGASERHSKRRYSKSNNWWNYHSRRVMLKFIPDLEQGLVNYFRICKSKWIEAQPTLTLIERKRLHERMNHSYMTTVQNYL